MTDPKDTKGSGSKAAAASTAPDGVITGTRGNDSIIGGYADADGDKVDGNDAILPGETGDDDIIYAGDGNDIVRAGDGDDEIHGGDGDDLLVGGAGDDDIYGGRGSDAIYGQDGNDNLYGSSGYEQISGGEGNDFIRGGTGKDVLFGDAGDDVILGDGGNADGYPVTVTFLGESAGYHNTIGIYTIDPNTGQISDIEIAFVDASAAGAGGNLTPGVGTYTYMAEPMTSIGMFNIADGGSLNNFASLGAGTYKFVNALGNPATIEDEVPTLVHVAPDGTETVLNGNIWHTAQADQNSDGLVHTRPLGPDSFGFEDLTNNGDKDFNDIVLGLDLGQSGARFDIPGLSLQAPIPVDTTGEAADTIDGGTGNDQIYAGNGDDHVTGGDGDDYVEGGKGHDTIIGGQGADTLLGGDDRDTFIGGTKGDVIDGGSGGDDFDTLDLSGVSGPINIVYTSTDQEDGYVEFGGSTDPADRLTFTDVESIIPCFTPGTLVATPRGEIPVEGLKAGDRVITRDNGFQEIQWVGQKKVTFKTFQQQPALKPILLRAGCLGDNLPERDMIVSPNHRVMLMGGSLDLHVNEPEVLVAAKHLLDRDGVHRVDMVQTTYIHFLCERHEVVLSDGTWTESFQPGDFSLNGIDQDQRNEVFALFPELKTRAGRADYVAARPVLRGYEAKFLG